MGTWRHAMRTAVGQIQGYADLLIEEATARAQADLVPDLVRIRQAGATILELLEQHPAGQGVPQRSGAAGGLAVAAALPGPPGRILLVDDDRDNRALFTRLLVRLGHEVWTAESGGQALQEAAARPLDLVLLDLIMPDMPGVEVLSRLKADPRLRHLPVLMISAIDEMASAIRCIELGAEDYLPKPVDATLLRARISACLEKKRRHDREVQLYAELSAQHRRLRELESLRDDLTQMLVHDMRTPVSSLLLSVQALQRQTLDEHDQKVLGRALRSGQTLLSMLNDILDVSRLESSGTLEVLTRRPVAIGPLVEQAIEEIAGLVELRGLRFVPDLAQDLPTLWADADLLRRVLVNLLGNALKFSPPDGRVLLRVRTQKDAVRFEVIDEGPGIPPDQRERIFEKFARVQGATLFTGSSGLGLTLCKMVVEAHGGRIWVEGEPGQGSAFCFSLPSHGPT